MIEQQETRHDQSRSGVPPLAGREAQNVDACHKAGHDNGRALRPQPFPWQQAMGFGLGVLRLSPDQFWRMTPRELACAIEMVSGHVAPLDRASFTDLMKGFPDDRR